MEETQAHPHSFLAEELLMPFANHCDANRMNMASSQAVQSLVLDEPEIPLIFTRFENQIGSYGMGVKKTAGKYIVIDAVPYSKHSYTLIVRNLDTGLAEAIDIKNCTHTSESYGYMHLTAPIESWVKGNIVEEGSLYSVASCYDSELNYKHGTNLRTAYYPHEGMTFEDAIVISESAANKLAHYEIKEYNVSVNLNDVLLNLYGDEGTYCPFPQVGEYIKDGILCVRRRMMNMSSFSWLNDRALSEMKGLDTTFYGEGQVIDIEPFSNQPLETFTDPAQYHIYALLDTQIRYSKSIARILGPYADKGKLDGSAGYKYKRALLKLDPNQKWRGREGRVFDSLMLKFTVSKYSPAVMGTKITNRYAGKGVVSSILPDAQMPRAEDGSHLEICLNPGGISNRQIYSSLFELETNMIAQKYLARFAGKPDAKRLEAVLKVLINLNAEQHGSLKEFADSITEGELTELLDEIWEKGLPIHVEPFFNESSIDNMRDLYEEFGVELDTITLPDGTKVETPIAVGQMYFQKLKHEPHTKMSARSLAHLNINDVPYKNNAKYKAGQALISATSVRFGWQEMGNAKLINNFDAIVDFLETNSTSKEKRRALAESQILHSNAPMERVFPKTNTKNIIAAYMAALGLELRESEA